MGECQKFVKTSAKELSSISLALGHVDSYPLSSSLYQQVCDEEHVPGRQYNLDTFIRMVLA